MLSSEARKSPQGYRYVGGMLNIAYLTGFVRDPSKTGFRLQQNNNLELAVPIVVPPNTKVPREFAPVTVMCHVHGLLNGGNRISELRAIDIKAPSTLSMPTWIAWNSAVPEHAHPDSFKPFGNNSELKGAIAEQVGDGDADQEDIVRVILESTKGHLDTRLGDNANVVLLSGIIESAALVRGNEYQTDHVGILLRQHGDPEKAIPVRLYSRQLQQHLKSVSVGLPVKVNGQARVKLIMADREDGDTSKPEIVGRETYIRCHELKTAERNVDVLTIPAWWNEIKERVIAKNSRPEALTSGAPSSTEGVVLADNGLPVVEGL